MDSSGNAYVAGYLGSTDFPTTLGAYQTTYAGDYDGFVTELNANGSALIYSTYLGGTDFDLIRNIAVDTTGNAYVVGETESSDFPTTPGAFQTTSAGNAAFVTELNPAGSALAYSTYLGGSSLDYGEGIAVDTAGNAYVTGYTYSSDFPTTPGAFQTTLAGDHGSDVFVTEFNPSGSALVYSTYLGGSGGGYGEYSRGIALDTAGNAYVMGHTSASDFPTTPGTIQTIFAGGTFDVFVSKLNPSGSALVYSTYLGGSDSDYAGNIEVDTSGNAHVTGFTESGDFPTTAGAFQTTSAGGFDAFVTELNPTGTKFLYSTYLGGGNEDYSFGIAIDTSGNSYIMGHTSSTHFPTTAGAYQTTFGGGEFDAFVAKIYDSGTAVFTKVDGEGTVDNQGNEVTFRFRATEGDEGGKLGLFTFCDPVASVCLTNAGIHKLVIKGNTAHVSGSGHLENQTDVRFRVSVTDNGSPGTSDAISITFDNGYSVSGAPTSGDIRIF